MPTVSVIVPLYNRAGRIVEALRAVCSQTLTDIEVIVVDDRSTDGSLAAAGEAAAGDARIRVLARETNGGPSGARNTGVAAARGDFVAFLDSDDLWAPEKLEAQLNAARARPEPGRVFCTTSTRVARGNGRADEILPRRPLTPGERVGDYLYAANEFFQCSSYFLGHDLARSIAFDERLRQYEDHLYVMAAEATGADFVQLPEVLTTWHDDDRDDRMARTDSIDRGRAFLGIARDGGMISARAARAFEVRYLGSAIAGESRLAAFRLALAAAAGGGIPRDAWLKLLVKAVLGPQGYARLRRQASRG